MYSPRTSSSISIAPEPSIESGTSAASAKQSQPAVEAPFVWGVGIECSFIPHISVDQFEWTQHDRFWKDDLRRIREDLGVTQLRYALPWYKIESKPGEYDWSMADERIEFCKDLGVNLLMDVMHFGTPLWLNQAVGDPRFPESLESFTRAMVGRYRSSISTWCPFNEPLVSALFSGDFGFWPPYSRKWRGYMPVLSRIVQSVNRSIAAIREVQPDATVLLCDAMENFQTHLPELQDEVNLRNVRRFVVLDLLAGRVDYRHSLYRWLNSFGFSELDLEYFRTHPQMPDVIGLDYYPHSDWQLDMYRGMLRQRRADAPRGVGLLATDVYNRYGLPMMVTETSIDGPPIARELWLDTMTSEIREVREEGIPLAGLIWWPLIDQIDWDGALTHRIGKLHRVGLFTLTRQADGTLQRSATPLAKHFKNTVAAGDESVGKLGNIARPAQQDDPQLAPLLTDASQYVSDGGAAQMKQPAPGTPAHVNGNGKGNGAAAPLTSSQISRQVADAEPAAGLAGEPVLAQKIMEGASIEATKSTGRYGIVCFSHLRWGFVWQRPQQFLSRFARLHPILFVEEPFFDLGAGQEPRVDMHRVLPTVVVVCPHLPPEAAKDPMLYSNMRAWVKEAIEKINTRGEFDKPLLWYYSPMDSAWSLGHFENRGVVYDCMDELSQFTGAPKELVDNERRLMDHADIVFTGGYELWTKKSAVHPNAHFYGCGVEFEHFNLAQSDATTIPPDIDFMSRPILGWFGVVDERVDYPLLAEVARLRPEWSIAIVGPVVKIDPNLLPHAPNLHWLGGRDYQVLPNYCKAFDVCMMCFALNRATEFINPTKALEYFATGKPVISTPVKDVLRQYSDLVEIASTPEEFVQKVGKLLHEPDQDRIARGIELAKSKSWEGHVASMRQNIKDAITQEKRRSTHVQPAPDPAPGYFFKHTQGS